MTYADPAKGSHPWVLDEEQSQPFFRKAIELGINVFDSADVYGAGSSEEVLGRAIKRYARREEVVGATKPHHLTDAVAAVSLRLTLDEVARLEEPYIPHRIAGI